MLPLAHTTYWESFLDAMRVNALAANSSCPIDKTKQVVYLFYGSPFYVLQNKEPLSIPTYQAASRPVGFLFKHEIADNLPADIFPFDTGAYAKGFYGNVLGSPGAVNLNEFRVQSKAGVGPAAQLVTAFYGGKNTDYILGDIAPPAALAPATANAVHRLYSSRTLSADTRKRVIEVLFGSDIPLKESLCAMIVPSRLFKRERAANAILDEFANSINEIIEYQDIQPFDPSADSRLILDRAITYLQKNGLIN